jgi:tetratricopeptide (TPR) repeat protein
MAEDSFLSDDFRQILQRFEQMVKENTSLYFDSEELEDLIFYYSDHFQFQKALLVIEHAHHLFPDHPVLTIREAEVYTGMGQLHKALNILKKVNVYGEEKLDWLMATSVAYSQLHEHDRAIFYLEQALEISEGENYDDIALELALEYQNANKVDKAIALLQRVIVNRPESETLLYELAFCFETTQRLAEGLKFYKELVDERPMSFPAWYCLGNLQQHLDLLEESVESYDFSNALMPDFAPALINKAQAQFKLKEYEAAIQTLEQTFSLEPPDATTFCHLGECYEKLGQIEKAKSYYQKSIDLDERCADAYLGMAVVLDYQNESSKALSYARIAHDFDAQNEEYLTVFIKLLNKLDMFEEALEKAEAFIHARPHDEETWSLMVDIYVRMEKYKEGMQYAEQGMQLIPDSKMIGYRKLLLLHATGMHQAAAQWLEQIYDQEDEQDMEELEMNYPAILHWPPYQNKKTIL